MTIDNIMRDAGITRAQLSAVLKGILETVAAGGKITIQEFGTFRQSKQKTREIHSPTLPGGKSTVPEMIIMKFRLTTKAKAYMNEGKTGMARGVNTTLRRKPGPPPGTNVNAPKPVPAVKVCGVAGKSKPGPDGSVKVITCVLDFGHDGKHSPVKPTTK